jgi:hypothetical protein
VTDVERAARVLKDKLQRIGAPLRTWIEFYDADLSDEWIGIWPDTPAPPRYPSN